jgi:hypothetical protein
MPTRPFRLAYSPFLAFYISSFWLMFFIFHHASHSNPSSWRRACSVRPVVALAASGGAGVRLNVVSLSGGSCRVPCLVVHVG